MICQRQKKRDHRLHASCALSSEACGKVTDKVCNARFNEVHDNYIKQNKLKGKGKLGLRGILLANVTAKTNTAAKTSTGNIIAIVVPIHKFGTLLLGENGAVSKELLDRKIFALTKSFEEVSSHETTADKDIKKTIKSIGGEVKESFSKNATCLLAEKKPAQGRSRARKRVRLK